MAKIRTIERTRAPKPMGQSASASGPWAAAHAATTTARGYGQAWRVLREQIMQRDAGMCQPCRRAGLVTAASAVDHIVSRSEWGTDDPGNLEAICAACHAKKTTAEARRHRR